MKTGLSPRSALLIAAAALLAGCGVRGAPNIPPPLFGDTDMPPGAPQPYPVSGQQPPFPASLPPQTTDIEPGEG